MTFFAPSHLKHRLIALAVILTASYAVLAGWLGYWQLAQQEKYAKIASENQLSQWSIPAPRGMITDINGTVLATSRPVKTVCVDPSVAVLPPNLDYCREMASRIIAEELDLPYPKVLKTTRPRWFFNAEGKEVPDRFEVLQREVSLDQWSRLTSALARLDFGLDESKLGHTNRATLQAIRTRMVFARDDFQRYYPGGRLASHVVGFVTKKHVNYPTGEISEMNGCGGIEQRFQKVLRGTPGWHRGRQTIEPRPGLNVVLTLDAGVQSIVEEELREAVEKWQARAGFAVAVRPRTGDILALASYPDFDPAQRTDMNALRNWAITCAPDPGSTIKVVTFAAGCEDRCFSWEEIIDCGRKPWKPPHGRAIKDSHYHGRLTAREVLVKSSNIGTAKLGISRIPPARFIEICRAFGLGARTGVPLPSESPGGLDTHPSPVDYPRMAYGYHINPTPLQMTMLYAAIANQGLLMRPRLIERITDLNGEPLRSYPPVVFRRAVSSRTARELTEVLQAVPTTEGTARAAKLALYTVAGKTGTADIYDPQHGYHSGKNYTSFVGFFPATRPEICLFVGIMAPRKGGRWGGKVAAPAWHDMAEQIAAYLRIRPDTQESFDRWPGELPSGVVPLAVGQTMNAPLRNY